MREAIPQNPTTAFKSNRLASILQVAPVTTAAALRGGKIGHHQASGRERRGGLSLDITDKCLFYFSREFSWLRTHQPEKHAVRSTNSCACVFSRDAFPAFAKYKKLSASAQFNPLIATCKRSLTKACSSALAVGVPELIGFLGMRIQPNFLLPTPGFPYSAAYRREH